MSPGHGFVADSSESVCCGAYCLCPRLCDSAGFLVFFVGGTSLSSGRWIVVGVVGWFRRDSFKSECCCASWRWPRSSFHIECLSKNITG